MKTYIGCSGYQYDDWKGKFYPEDLPQKDWLAYYADRFNSVEINGTFYSLPEKDTVRDWFDQVPGNFKFTLKGSQYVTHMKKLNDPEEPLAKFYKVAEELGGKIGCILWQLPGNLKKDAEKLSNFCKALSSDFNNVLEVRHNSWFDDEVYEILRKHEVSFCILSAPDDLRDDVIKTSDKAYMRFHGEKNWYSDHYNEKQLKEWSARLKEIKGLQNRYLYFNNDYSAYAPENAKTMQDLLED